MRRVWNKETEEALKMSEKNKKALILIGVIVLVVLVTAGAVAAILPTPEDTHPEGQYISAQQAFRFENETVYSVFAEDDGIYQLTVEGKSGEVERLLVNGLETGIEIKGGKAEIELHKGINSVSLVSAKSPEDSAITGIAVKDCPQYAKYGAFVTYIAYEAEDCENTGTVSDENRDYRSFASEASGRKYVALESEGEEVTLKLTSPANALVIRYCVPDSEDGKGLLGKVELIVDGVSQPLQLSSQNCWVYGAFPWNNEPSTANQGGPHFFFDDVRVVLDKVYPEGTEITIRKGSDFAYCLVDLVEAEEIGSPIPQPENALSITDFGAVPNDGEDDSAALTECIREAMSQGKEVYIPAGEFDIRKQPYVQGIPIREDDVTIRGAGMWYTVLRGEAAGFNIQAGHIHFYDFSLLGNVKQRKDSIDPPAFNMTQPTPGVKDIRLQNIWIEHFKVGLWADVVNSISVMGCRIRNTYADGINLCGGTSNCVITQNDLRNTGDDAIAMFNRGVLCVGNKVLNNTIALPWLANNVALYGGKDIEVKNNLLKDTICFGAGVNISTNFNPQVFEGEILVEDNYMLRCGSREWNINADYGAVWVNTVEGYDNVKAHIIVRNNLIESSTYQGVSFFNSGTVENIEFTQNVIKDSGTWAFGIGPEARGSATIRDNEISGVGLGEFENQAGENFTVKE